MYWAAARAAKRRGASMTILPPIRQGASSRQIGIRVVLPAPGEAWTMAFGVTSRLAQRSGRMSSIGSKVMGENRGGYDELYQAQMAKAPA